MSDVMQPNPNVASEIPIPVQMPLDEPALKAARERREQWFARMFAEGQLRSAEERARVEQIIAEWEAEPVLSMEEIYAQIDRTTSLEEIIAAMREEAEAEQ